MIDQEKAPHVSPIMFRSVTVANGFAR